MSFRILVAVLALFAVTATHAASPATSASSLREIERVSAIAGLSARVAPITSPWVGPTSSLQTRTLDVSADDQITLMPHEVILTFDDGPSALYTPETLRILDAYGVKATFMMVGEMAEMHPEAARAVALDGQTIGTHTYQHPNLAKMPPAAAVAEIQHGKEAVAAVLAPINVKPTPFFRFPYLASDWSLQAMLMMDGTISLGVQIDSDDYFRDSPLQTLDHLLTQLDTKGRGIILFHDIHAKTVLVLPLFLQALANRGYTVVELKASHPSPFARPLVTATL